MLRKIRIRNFAIIQDLEIEPGNGLNVFTGETGAGKSILIEAFGFLLGSRSNPDWLRPSGKLEVSGVFDVEDLPPELRATRLLDGPTVSVRREIDHGGKSRAYLDGKPITLSQLAALGSELVDFHGQHENQTLLKPQMQLELLDRYAGLEEQRAELASVYQQSEKLRKSLDAMRLSEEEKLRRLDLYRFQVADIEDARLTPGEEEEAQELLPKIRNAEKIRRFAAELYNTLRRDDESVEEGLAASERAARDLADLDPGAAEVRDLLAQAATLVEEAADRAQGFADKAQIDPDEAERILSRLEQISKLKKKYGRDIPSILDYLERIKDEMEGLENADETEARVRAELEKIETRLAGLCEDLHTERMAVAKKLSARIVKDLRVLGMPQARFSISVEMEEGRFTPTGSDRVTYLFSSNPGEPLKGVSNVASGGELARVMLALKSLLAKQDRISVLVFDEVDTGIGGLVARAVGDKLAVISASHQVLCVTHLPQIACYGNSHFQVAKEHEGGRTHVVVRPLEGKVRMEEVARMLGGAGDLSRSSRSYARELLKDIQGR